MSQENVDLFGRYALAFNRRDLGELSEMTHADFQFISILSAVDETT
jgi:hypothetical protein